MEGYKEEFGRAGAGYTAYDYELSKNLPPRDGVGTHTRAAVETGRTLSEGGRPRGRESQRPSGAPPQRSSGSDQSRLRADHGDLRALEQYLDLVKSPYNGMTFDCGVTREMGEDPIAVCRYLGERDCINHVHFRNVIVRTPYVDYTEVFLDDGQVDMFGVMKELVRQKYHTRSTLNIRARSTSIARMERSAISIPVAAGSPGRSTTSPTRERCCRRR